MLPVKRKHPTEETENPPGYGKRLLGFFSNQNESGTFGKDEYCIRINDNDVMEIKRKLKEKVKNEFSIEVKKKEGLEIRKLETKLLHLNVGQKVQKVCIGTPTTKPTKVILLVGATGAGKTTLINTMVNYIYNVEFSDNFRFILIDDNAAKEKTQAKSQTELITAYCFYYLKGMPFEYNYILIDTPGFGDTDGIERDREMMKQLGNFFKQSYGIDTVDCVGLVTPSTAARLTPTQSYIYDGLSSMFGRDIKDNIYVMVTFADANKPPVLEGLEEAKVDYTGHYKFNNSALFASNKGDNSSNNSDSDDEKTYMTNCFWKMGLKSMKNFFKQLGQTKPVSLVLTQEVLRERERLETSLNGLQNQIHLGIGKLATLQEERDILNRFDDDMKGSADYEYWATKPVINEISIPPGTYSTTCKSCTWSCHYGCIYDDNDDKASCVAMDSSGNCTACPQKCHWTLHKNYPYKIERTTVKEKQILKDKLNHYNKAKAGKLDKEYYVNAIEADIKNSGEALMKTIKNAQGTIGRLEKIALKPNPLSTVKYIDILIENESNVKNSNFKERIEILNKLRRKAIFLQDIRGTQMNSGGTDIFEHFQKKIAEKTIRNNK